MSLHDHQAINGGEEYAHKEWELEFLRYLPYIKNDDFLGIQNYTRNVYDNNGITKNHHNSRKKTLMGYEYYPEALEKVIRKVNKELNIPLLVSENGIATNDDNERCAFIKTALQGIKNCLNDHIDITGYLHWSLLDNFEWQKGYDYPFGLIEVDRKTFKRYPKESLYYLYKQSEQLNLI